MYPTYELVVGDEIRGWQRVEGTEASSRPHHYDTLRQEFERLVKNAKPYAAHFVKGFGYRIVTDHGRVVVDEWKA